ncbi:acidic mammalian chitinase-like isoform X2 [Corythoichthys intestinalis]|uniref:acidic mammalian chitinase-like isoform X2 n=1 Tax=Corythoichthys intestinalis TaxID=161448 RepID=UPI0025A64EB2|nr:acidic mammalian chitinase-like isoform X2 [Corythoichthys intestinalis]
MQKCILLAGFYLFAAQLGSTTNIVCQYESTSAVHSSQFDIARISGDLCTHLIYSSVNINSNFEISPTTDEFKKMNAFTAISSQSSSVKKLLEVNLTINTPMVFGDRHSFILNTITFLRGQNFDGINLWWGTEQVTANTISLISEFRTKINQEARLFEKPQLLLTMSVPAIHFNNIHLIASDVDFLNVMTSDIEKYIKSQRPSLWSTTDSYNEAVNAMYNWRDEGAPANKLNMGIAVFAETTSDTASTFTDLPRGFMPLSEVCNWIHLKSPLVGEITFDTQTEIIQKANFVSTNHFGGVFVMSLNLDYFDVEFCNGRFGEIGPYPVIKTLKNYFK